MLIPQCNRLMRYSNSNNTCRSYRFHPNRVFFLFFYTVFSVWLFFSRFVLNFSFILVILPTFFLFFFRGFFFLLLRFSFSCVFLHSSNSSFTIFTSIFSFILVVLPTFFGFPFVFFFCYSIFHFRAFSFVFRVIYRVWFIFRGSFYISSIDEIIWYQCTEIRCVLY